MALELEENSFQTEVLDAPVQEAARESAGAPKTVGRLRAFLIAGGVLAIATAGTGSYLHFQNRVSTDDAQVDAHNAPIAPKISGNIVEILVDDNQMVKAGQVLVRIDPRDYQAKVDQARAALAVAERQAAGARAGVPLADGATASAVAAAQSQ